MSTCRDVSRERELISIARDWLPLLRSESFTGFSITMYVSNTKSILVERISLLFLDKYSFDNISWFSSKGTMGESSQTSGVSRDRKL